MSGWESNQVLFQRHVRANKGECCMSEKDGYNAYL